MSNPQRTHENNSSSLFERLTPDQRKALDIAIIERLPPTFQAVWMDHKLASFGVSFTAFYRYARRLRDRANLAEISALAADNDGEMHVAIRKLIYRRLAEMLLNTDDADYIREINGLISSCRQLERQEARIKHQLESSRLAWARLEHDRERLRLLANNLPAGGARPLRLAGDSNGDHLARIEAPTPVPARLAADS